MDKQLLEKILPNIEAKAEKMEEDFLELALEEDSETNYNGWIEEKIFNTDFVEDFDFDFGDDEINEMIRENEELKEEVNDIIKKEVAKYIDWGNNYEPDDFMRWECTWSV